MRDYLVTRTSIESAKELLNDLRNRHDFESAHWEDVHTFTAVGGGLKPSSWWSVTCSVVLPKGTES